MIEFTISLLSIAATMGIFTAILALALRKFANVPPRQVAGIWLFFAFAPVILLVLGLAGQQSGRFDLVTTAQSVVLRGASVTLVDNSLFRLSDGNWQPMPGVMILLRVFFAIWAVGAFALLIIRGYQLFLAQQFSVWANDLEDERVRDEAKYMGWSFGMATPQIRESVLVRSPLVVGVRKFTLLMPAGMSRDLTDDELRAILAHEFSHIAKADTRVLALLIINECLFWFSPFTWLVQRNWATYRELDADREAILRSSIEPKRFANLLVRIVTSSKTPWLQTAIGATRDFKALKRRILNMSRPTTDFPSSRGFVFLSCFMGTWLGMSVSLRPTFERITDSNLVIDGGFESGLETWRPGTMPEESDTGVTYKLDTEVYHSGHASLKYTKQRPTYFPIQVMRPQLMPYRMTKRVETTCWMKARNAGKATICLVFHRKGHESDYHWAVYASGPKPDVGVTHDWKQYQSVVAVPEDTTSVEMLVQMYGPGEAWFDDVSLKFVADETPIVEAVDMTKG
ncbi:MAG: M48 family metalloprotease [Armatimonadetes bacterium]|nr:M48 family metalloprotease [Armatimonadota bacterium]